MSDELVVSFSFPSSNFVSAITVLKRIIENNNSADVLSVKNNDDFLEFNEIIDEYIDDRIILDLECSEDNPDCIFRFTDKGLKSIKKDYSKIYSRSWFMANHFLAFEYKLSDESVFWRAEFSDPLLLTMKNNYKSSPSMNITDEVFIDRLNSKITELNSENNSDYDLVENPSSAYFICEYIVYLFADEIVFTNENQRKIMLDRFPIDVKSRVLAKSQIKPHPTLPDKFYHIRDIHLDLNDEYINIAYFGNEFYGLRHFEGLFYAINTLNHKFLSRVKFYFFINDNELFNLLTRDFDNITVKKPLEYLDFLNATTKFDILLVNDADTSRYFEINPYLPSKISDYLGSGRDIWSICEKNSSLSRIDVKYKSFANDYSSIRDTLIRILDDNDLADEDYSINEDYLADRFTELNEILEKENLRKNKYKKLKKDDDSSKKSLLKSLGKFKRRHG